MNEKEKTVLTGKEIAVIGMAGRFPGAANIDEFWHNLVTGIESIYFFSDRELQEAGSDIQLIGHPNYVKAKGILEDKEYFDASFFGYTPGEAGIMTPQMRIFHESAWEALEDAGYDPGQYEGLIGLYAGAASTTHWEALIHLSGKDAEIGEFAAQQLISKDYVNAKISYNFDLKGPVFSIHTACSTSLVAIHLACRGLLTGECKMALAGGIAISASPVSGYLYQEGMVFSPDGHCRAFDANSRGLISGEGLGLVVLKRLKSAITDGDFIYAVIKGSAINNDGKRKVGFTAPSVEAQAEVIGTAQRISGVEPAAIGYVEAHGTGTILGDPVEIEALTMAFDTCQQGSCAIGSVKTNIGHLDAAAGVAGFIKTVLVLQHKVIPPTLHFETPNSRIAFEKSPFYVNTKTKKWERTDTPLRAAVSSLGIGGTNAHVILEEAPFAQSAGRQALSAAREYRLILLSARTETALEKMTANLAEYLKNTLKNHGNHKNPINPDQNPAPVLCQGANDSKANARRAIRQPKVDAALALADAAYTLQVGRRVFEHRRMLLCASPDEAVEALSTPTSRKVKTLSAVPARQTVVFMFTGQGSQYINMGLELYRHEPTFKEDMDNCFARLQQITGHDIKKILFPGPGENIEEAEARICEQEFVQPVLFVFEYALARLLIKWGIEPQAMIGYSIGEITAAYFAGVFSLNDALKLVSLRGRLMQKMPAGVMSSVPMPEEQITSLLNQELSLAAVNGPSCIVSGPETAIDAFEKKLKANRCICTRLNVPCASHSKMLEPLLKEFADRVSRLTLNKPGIPVVSSVTGKWLTTEEAASPGYWASQIRETVRFIEGVENTLKGENSIFIEIGPGGDLTALVDRTMDNESNSHFINLIRHSQRKISDIYFLLDKIGQLWLYGKRINWTAFYAGEQRFRIPLPPYPFEKKHYPVPAFETDTFTIKEKITPKKTPTGKKQDTADWFYLPSWKRTITPAANTGQSPGKSCILIFADISRLAALLEKQLAGKGHDVIMVREGKEFSKVNDREYTIDPRHSRHYLSLMTGIKTGGKTPGIIVHCWSITAADNKKLDIEAFDRAQELGMYSLIYLAKAISKLDFGCNFEIIVVSNSMYEVTGAEKLCPEKAPLLGPLKVIPQEYPFITCRSLDIVLPEPGSPEEKKMPDRLEAELWLHEPGTAAAYRNGYRWIQTFDPIRLGNVPGDIPKLKKGGCYLITGGLGDIGLTLAEYLAAAVGAKLVLTRRSPFPPREKWEEWLSRHEENDPLCIKIRKLRKIEESGGKVLVFNVDAADQKGMEQVITRSEKQLGPINGVIHGAGVVDGKSIALIANLDIPGCREQFQPKAYGLLVLEQVLQNRELDFCLLISSLSPILGGLTLTAYASANLFMDAFVYKHNRESLTPWISLNWGDWQRREASSPGTNMASELFELAMTPAEAIETFRRVLYRHHPGQFIVSAGDLQSRIDRWIKLEALREEEKPEKNNSAGLFKRPHLLSPYVAPSTDIEKKLTGIWQDLFGIDRIGIQDDFLELGGDSLKAVTIIAKIHKGFNVEIPIAEFFNYPTIEATASRIKNSARQAAYTAVTRAEKKEYYMLSPAQARWYLLYQLDTDRTTYNEGIAIWLEGKLERQKMQEVFRQIINRHEVFRTSIASLGGNLYQEPHEPGTFDFSIAYFESDEENTGKIIKNFKQPFDLERIPLLRIGLIKVGETKHILMGDMPHIVTDGASMSILLKEFMGLYQEKELPPLKIQYKDYVEWQNRCLDSAELKEQEEFWIKRFPGRIPVLDLPLDYERPPIKSFEGKVLKFQLGKEETRALKQMAAREEATLFMVMLALYNVFLSRISGQEEIVVGVPTGGRGHTDLENIIGLFIKTFAFINYPTGTKSFREFLQEVREGTLRTFENQDYQFSTLVEKIGGKRDASRTPLFDVSLNYLNDDEQLMATLETDASALKVRRYHEEKRTAAHDLTLYPFDAGETLLFSLEYCTKLFKQETIETFIDYFKEIVSIVINNNEIKLESINVSHHLIRTELDISREDLEDFAF